MDVSKIKPLDYILTTSLSWLAECIRIKEVGLWRAFDQRIATHAGIAVPDINGNLFIAEMLGNGLRISPFSDYLKSGFGKARIVCVRRNIVYDNKFTALARVKQIYTDAHECLKYDYDGILEFVFPQIKDKPGKFYCSELLQHYAIEDGAKISVPHKQNGDSDNCSPWDIQISESLLKVE